MARQKQPAIVFFDEIDSIGGNRGEGENESSRRVKNEMLTQIEGASSKNGEIFILAATNLPWALDPALRRRFDRMVYIPLPDLEARIILIKNTLSNLDSKLTE